MPEDQSANAAVVDGDGAAAPSAEETRFRNQSAEFNRKLDNAVGSMQGKIDALLSKLTPAAPAAVEPDLDSLLYSDPKAYARELKAQTKREVLEEVRGVSDTENAKNAILGKLVGDFPELRDQTSDLAKAATAEYAALPAHIKSAPEAYEIAVSRAAFKQGSKPMSQRNDDFTLSSTTGSKPRTARKDEEMDAVLQVAALFGKDISDPAYVKTLKGHTKRDYSKYREPKSVKE